MGLFGGLFKAGSGLLGNIFGGIQGSRLGKKQMQMGQQMIDEAQALSAAYERPEFQTPAAINLMTEMAQGRQFQNLPGMAMMQNQINQATAGGLGAIERMGTGAEGFGAVSDLYKNQLGAQGNLAIQNAQFRDQGQAQYMGALENLGQWQHRGWQWEEADPYLAAQQKASQLEMMGRQGQWEGLKTKMGSWAEAFKGGGNFIAGGGLDPVLGLIGN